MQYPSAAAPPPRPAAHRYQVAFAASNTRLTIVDRWTGLEFLRCCGDIASFVLAQLGLDSASADSVVHIDKDTVHQLALAVTAARLRTCPDQERVPLAADRLLLRLMRDCRGVHFTTARAALLLDFHGIGSVESNVAAALSRLVEAGCLSAIQAGDDVYFDTDTRPHWHVYVEADAELCDLELTGDDNVDRRLVATLRSTMADGLRFIRS